MIVGLGVDLLENSRFAQELARDEWRQENGVFTSEEIKRCSSGKNPALHYAACFAVKEATLKALGVGVSDLAVFREVEIGLDENGDHAVVLHDRLQSESEQLGVRHIRVSIAAAAKQTGAMVILES
ncbi:MAG: holo-ACP synthase [Candidatus Korobacteraceae bacterium]